MKNIIEIKANSKELAISRAKKILEVAAEEIVEVEEVKKPWSLFGFFSKEGVYKVTVIKKEKVVISDEQKAIEEILETKEEAIIIDENLEKDVNNKLVESKEFQIKELAQNLLNKMGLNLEVEIIRIEGRNCTINLYGEDNGIIIGKKGKTLNSYEYLLNTLIKDFRIEVDVEGFKEKRVETLRELAKKMAEKALKTSKPIKLNPMPPKERKIIHEVVNKYSELDTYSEGKDPKRYIVIKRKK